MDEVHGIEFFFGVSRIRDFGACKPASWAVTIALRAGRVQARHMLATPTRPITGFRADPVALETTHLASLSILPH